MTEHSKLGASGAERWMACPGSVDLLKHLQLPESDDPSYRAEGTAMHHWGEGCLVEELDAWELVGDTYEGITLDDEMALHVQAYVDFCRRLAEGSTKYRVEFNISAPVHPLFFGTADFVAEFPDRLHVVDLKGGVGIVVDPDDNPQLKYYAFGVIYGIENDLTHCLPDAMPVFLTIFQPRAFHSDGVPHHTWETTVGEIKSWTHDTLVPAMVRAELDNELDAGAWCRFCPAKLVCPLLTSLFGTAATADPGHVVNLDDQSLGRSYQYLQAVEFYVKALKDEALKRALNGRILPGVKVVNKRANRVWKDGALAEAIAQFGEDALTKPDLKTPPAIDALGPKGKQFTAGHAYTPQNGFTLALESSKAPAVIIKPTSEEFAAQIKSLDNE